MRLTTPRLTLQPLSIDCLEATHAYASDPETTRYMMNLPTQSLEETAEFIRDCEREWQRDRPGRYEFAVFYEDRQIGGIALIMLEDGAAELGWILNRAYWGNGFAGEAARAVMAHARSALGIRRFIAQCDSENAASYRLMERLGMKRVSVTGGRKNRSSDEERQELTYELRL